MSFSVSQLKHHLISKSRISINQDKIKVTVSIPHIDHFKTWYPVCARMLLARCEDVFVKDLFMFCFVSFVSK